MILHMILGDHAMLTAILFAGLAYMLTSGGRGKRKRVGKSPARPKFTRPVISLHGENEVAGRPERIWWVHGEPGPRVERKRRWER